MNETLLRALITIAFGALAGGLTNTVAIWMLFHPYEPPRVGRRRVRFLHGAVPKNQERLAKAIGRTVGQRLLTDDDLAEVLSAGEFRAAFDNRLEAFLDALLERERGPLRELLPEGLADELDDVIEDIVDHAAQRLVQWVQSEDFEREIASKSSVLLEAVSDEPVAGVLTPAREDMLTEAIDEWIQDAVETEGFREGVSDYLARASERLLEPDRTFEEILPKGLVASVERAVADYLPLAARRLGGLLEDEDARAKFQRTVNELLHRFLQDLKFHQRVVAKLVMTEDTVSRVLDTIEAEGAERLGEMLREPEVQLAMSKGVNDAFVDLLRRPVSSVLGEPGAANVQEAIETLTDSLVRMARDPRSRQYLVERLERGLDKAGARTWGDVLGGVPPEKLARWIAEAARSDTAERLSREAISRFARGLLDRPIGRPARWLPDGGTERIRRTIADPLWGWLQGQVPEVVSRVDVARRVEEKVRAFPTAKLEELVRRVTDRELRMIVRLGYGLGAMIGGVLVGVDVVLPRLLAWIGL